MSVNLIITDFFRLINLPINLNKFAFAILFVVFFQMIKKPTEIKFTLVIFFFDTLQILLSSFFFWKGESCSTKI